MTESLVDYCLRANMPELAEEWHPEKNKELTPRDVSFGSNIKVWWRCERGHEWQAAVRTRAQGTGCPYCTGRKICAGENDLAATHPELAREWHPEKNGLLTPEQVSAGSKHRAWWRCEKGHEWQARIRSRSGGCGCPVCSGRQVLPGYNDLSSRYPAIAAQWHPEKNGALTPGQVTAFSNRKVWWRCEKGHGYAAAIAQRTGRASGCPYCAGRKVLVGFNDLGSVAPEVAAQWYSPLNGSLTPDMVTYGSRKKVWWQCGEGHVWKAAVYSRTGEKRHGCPVCSGRV